MNSKTLNVLLDTTYLLPTFGVTVRGLGLEDIDRLRRLAVAGRVKFYCLSVVWVELLGKVSRETEKVGRDTTDIVSLAIESLLKSGLYIWLEPKSEDLIIAFKIRLDGHKDLIDNILYATSLNNNLILLTMDRELKEFLEKKNYKTENIKEHKELFKEIA